MGGGVGEREGEKTNMFLSRLAGTENVNPKVPL